jgi:hypothetical protein
LRLARRNSIPKPVVSMQPVKSDQGYTTGVMPMDDNDDNDSTADYYLAQAARCRRFAAEIARTHPDIAAELEALAQQFERRAAVISGIEPKG